MNASEPQAPPDLPRQVPIRRNNGFRMLWIGQLLSDTGSEIGLLAYPLLILALTHSAVLAGVVGTVRAITLLCLQLPAGALSDRLDRRLTMIVCDVMRAALLALLAVLIVTHLATWPVVLIVCVVEGGAGAIFNPAATAALPAIVTDGQLEEAWAATEGRTYVASLAGPALGGVLFGLGRAVPFLTDAVSYAVSFGTVSRIRGRFGPRAALFAVMLRSTPAEMRGRVTNTVLMVATGLAALAPLVAGLLVQHGSGSWAVGAFAATMAVAAVLCLVLPGLREAESAVESPRRPS